MIVLFFSTFSMLACVPYLIMDFHPISARQLFFLLLTGLAAAGGQFGVTAAYTYAPAREISVYDYTQIYVLSNYGASRFWTASRYAEFCRILCDHCSRSDYVSL